MGQRGRMPLGVAFVIGLLAVGMPYLRVPCAEASLPDSILGDGLAAVVVAPAWLCATSRVSFKAALLAAAPGPVAAGLVRAMVSVARDPALHHPWPLELLPASAVGFPRTAGGALVGSPLRGAFRRG